MEIIPTKSIDIQMDNLAGMLDMNLPSMVVEASKGSSNTLLRLIADMINDRDLIPVLVSSTDEPSLGRQLNLHERLTRYLSKLGMGDRKVHYMKALPNNGVLGLLSLLSSVYIIDY